MASFADRFSEMIAGPAALRFVVQPIIAGIIIDHAGYASAFYLTAGIALFGAVWWAVGVPRIRQLDFD